MSTSCQIKKPEWKRGIVHAGAHWAGAGVHELPEDQTLEEWLEKMDLPTDPALYRLIRVRKCTGLDFVRKASPEDWIDIEDLEEHANDRMVDALPDCFGDWEGKLASFREGAGEAWASWVRTFVRTWIQIDLVMVHPEDLHHVDDVAKIRRSTDG